jgi:3-oxoadipate enol-lactonase
VATTPTKAEKILGAIRGATLARIPHAGHSSTVEQPAAVTEVIGSFLKSLS